MGMDLVMVRRTINHAYSNIVSSTGLLCARQAVAKHHSSPEAPLTEDVSITDFVQCHMYKRILGYYHHLWLRWGTGILFYRPRKSRPKYSYSNSKSPT